MTIMTSKRPKKTVISEREKLEVTASLAIYLLDMNERLKTLENSSEGIDIEQMMVEAVVDGHELVAIALGESGGA